MDSIFRQDLKEWIIQFLSLFYVNDDTGTVTLASTGDELPKAVLQLKSLASAQGIELEKAVWRKYPNVCPYCLQKPCACGPKKARVHTRLLAATPTSLTIGQLQRMLSEIYPQKKPAFVELFDVIKEVGEVSRAPSHLEIEEEFADTFVRVARIANTLGLSLSNET